MPLEVYTHRDEEQLTGFFDEPSVETELNWEIEDAQKRTRSACLMVVFREESLPGC